MIGIFDSGVGGLTVVKEVIKELPQSQIVYFGDTARLPYGTKGADFVKKYSAKITDWLLNKGAKVIVVACHTSSAWAADFLKENFKDVPIFDMINFSAKEVASQTKNKKVGIIGTPGTIKSGAWSAKIKSIDPKIKIISQACPLFVPMVEMGFTKGKVTEEIAKEYLKKIKASKADVLVLACTHYPLLEKTIKKVIGPKVKIINPGKIVAKKVKEYLKQNPELKMGQGSSREYFFSDEPYNLEKIDKKIKPVIGDPFNG